jgi:hypothetical protein
MDTNKQIKIRINLNSREFEVQGEQEIIFKNFGELIKEYLDSIKKEPIIKNVSEEPHNKGVKPATNYQSTEGANEPLPDNFGEFYHKFPKTLSNVDKLLVACLFVQANSEGKYYTLKEANDLLIQQGVKLSNANAFNAANNETKRIFKISSKNYKVSDIGVEYIKSMIQSQ